MVLTEPMLTKMMPTKMVLTKVMLTNVMLTKVMPTKMVLIKVMLTKAMLTKAVLTEATGRLLRRSAPRATCERLLGFSPSSSQPQRRLPRRSAHCYIAHCMAHYWRITWCITTSTPHPLALACKHPIGQHSAPPP